MSFFRAATRVACCFDWKCLSFLDDIIYISSSLDGCSYNWIPRSAILTTDCLANLSDTRIDPLEWVVNLLPSSVDIMSSNVYTKEGLAIFTLFSFKLCLALL